MSEEYIGKYISLTSKKNIRYAGVLHSLNTETATMTLQNVRSYGTEDRPAERFVPPMPNSFAFIEFKGQDISGLEVFDSIPEDTEPAAPFVDPAIVNTVAAPPAATPPAAAAPAGGPNQYTVPRFPNESRGQPATRSPYVPQSSGSNRGGRSGPHSGQRRQPSSQQTTPRGGRPPRAAPEPLKFDGDFDFEASNAKLEEEMGKLSVEDDDESKPAYNKDDFFDSLTRESNDSGRMSFREERNINGQTFGNEGFTYRSRAGHRGRGRGRGRGGRGGGRGANSDRAPSSNWRRSGGQAASS